MALKFLTLQPRQHHLPLLIYFPGMDGTGLLFARQGELLSHRFDVCCLAIPGNDLSEWDELVEQSLKLISKELATNSLCARHVHLCGESFGACLAMLVAAQLPSVQQLTLINPASSFARLPWLMAGSLVANVLPESLYQASTRVLASLLIEMDLVPAVDRQHLIQAMLSIDAQTAAWRLGLLRKFQVHAVVPHLVGISTLLIAGERDRLLPSKLEVQILQRQLPQSKVIFLPSSGHACLLEAETSLAQIL
jgi:pimeloyl-ACP methyl ester carboxylesterase